MARTSTVTDAVILSENKAAVAAGVSREAMATKLGMEVGTLAGRLNSLRKGIRDNILAVRPDISEEKLEMAVELQCPISKTRVHGRPSSKKELTKNLANEALALLDAQDAQDAKNAQDSVDNTPEA